VTILYFCSITLTGPDHGPAGTGHVLDDYADTQGVQQSRLLVLRRDVGLSARIEGYYIGQRDGPFIPERAIPAALSGGTNIMKLHTVGQA